MGALGKLIYRQQDLAELGIPFNANTLRRLEAEGTFPRRISLGPKLTGWSARQIEQWLTDRENSAEADAAQRAEKAATHARSRSPRSPSSVAIERRAERFQALADKARRELAERVVGKP